MDIGADTVINHHNDKKRNGIVKVMMLNVGIIGLPLFPIGVLMKSLGLTIIFHP